MSQTDELRQAATDTQRAETLVERGLMALADGDAERAQRLFSAAYQCLSATATRLDALVREASVSMVEVGC